MILYKHKGEDMSREHVPLNLVGGVEQWICNPFVGGTSAGRSMYTHIVDTEYLRQYMYYAEYKIHACY